MEMYKLQKSDVESAEMDLVGFRSRFNNTTIEDKKRLMKRLQSFTERLEQDIKQN